MYTSFTIRFNNETIRIGVTLLVTSYSSILYFLLISLARVSTTSIIEIFPVIVHIVLYTVVSNNKEMKYGYLEHLITMINFLVNYDRTPSRRDISCVLPSTSLRFSSNFHVFLYSKKFYNNQIFFFHVSFIFCWLVQLKICFPVYTIIKLYYNIIYQVILYITII